MTKFNRFAKELDAAVKAYFGRYKAAENTVESLKEKIKEKEKEVRDLQVQGDKKAWTARYDLEGLKVQLNEAEDHFTEIKKSNADTLSSLREIRGRLEAAANEEFAIDPGKVDANFVTLIKSGIMNVADFESLTDRAERERNYTMLRLLGPAAESQIEDLRKNGRLQDAERLSLVATRSGQYTTTKVLEQYDALTFVAKKALGDPAAYSWEKAQPNPLFYNHWEELTGDAVESF